MQDLATLWSPLSDNFGPLATFWGSESVNDMEALLNDSFYMSNHLFEM